MSRNRRIVKAVRFAGVGFSVRGLKAFATAATFLLLAACQLGAQGDKQAKDSRSRPQSNLNMPAKLPSGWKKGMAYADFRSAAIATGWSAVVDPQCKANVIGENYIGLCSTHPELDDCHVCDDIPELGACSGDGYCGMTFSKHAQTLEVTTYGMTEDRKVSGNGSRLQVVEWKVEAKAN
jgi:hypothetical protein